VTRFRLGFILLLLGLASDALLARPGGAPATYSNPVIDADFPDPAVLRASDGYYYVYATQSEQEGRMANIQVETG
jgi:arabinan endo-1,5-alpha-L-arabinosidase